MRRVVDCHVLEDGRRVLSQRGAVALLQGESGVAKDGKIDRLLSRIPKEFAPFTVGPNIEFEHPKGVGFGRRVCEALGVTVQSQL